MLKEDNVSAINWRRLLAWQLDWILCVIFIQIVANFFSIKQLQSAIIPNTGLHLDLILGLTITTHILSLSVPSIDMLIPIAFFLLYRSAMESSKQQGSLGHMFFGLKVTNSLNNRVSFLVSIWRNFLIFISSIVLFLDCWKSLRSTSTWHDRVTKTRTIESSSELKFYRGLLITYICSFGYLAIITEKTRHYVEWLSQYTDAMNSEEIQRQANLIKLFNILCDGVLYMAAFIVAISLFYLLKSLMQNRSKTLVLQQEAYLALAVFLCPPIASIMLGAFSLYILYEQNQALINSIPN
ncbi:MAG: hypothetical protein EYC62_01055 [Alphaproteobacteria bacterium]|nr:MAG: hypothetical protein EYC62_01055 [Alphaproteobacteria bacterium]